MNKVRNFGIIMLVLLAVIAVVIAFALNTDSEPQMSLDFFANTVSGEEIRLHDNIGKTPTVLVFFDTEVEGSLDVLDRVIAKADGVEVVAVSVKSTDVEAQREKLSDAAAKLDKLCFEGADAVQKYNIGNAPVTYFIDKDGYVITGFIGNIKDDSITEYTDKIKKDA